MGSSVNKVMLLGNLGKDPEVKQVGDRTVANFSVATSETWTDKASGEKKERTEWSRIVAWGKTAELCGQFLRKGHKVYLEGKLQTREWEKDGQKRSTTEIVADQVVFLTPKGESGSRSEPPPPGDDDRPY